jgi:hypothetical protein
LTNSAERVARAQLEHAGLFMLFERVLSADTVRRLKRASCSSSDGGTASSRSCSRSSVGSGRHCDACPTTAR